MTEPTDADWKQADEVFGQIDSMGPAMTYRTIAVALAEARAKAGEPFLRIADACVRATELPEISEERATGFLIAAAKIRRAAEEG